MDFSIDAFANTIRDTLYDNFPYLKGRGFNKNGKPKHKNHNEEIREVALKRNPILASENKVVFDIGNNYAEQYYPYYHILNDADVIRIRGKGTKKSKGSQVEIEKLSDRDYGIVSWNGKTYSKEYQRNVRGKRSRADKGRKYVVGSDGEVYSVNPNANYYYNKHFQYIDRILDETITFIAQSYGLKMLRKQDSGLQEEYNLSNHTDTTSLSIENILDAFSSFFEE